MLEDAPIASTAAATSPGELRSATSLFIENTVRGSSSRRTTVICLAKDQVRDQTPFLCAIYFLRDEHDLSPRLKPFQASACDDQTRSRSFVPHDESGLRPSSTSISSQSRRRSGPRSFRIGLRRSRPPDSLAKYTCLPEH
mmetsp:Transcript_11413/g.23146  ORF Transcript_11413/g.23146 Transcript_11413/m.23146 type:complete len:140 (-) Transcript_11413:2338-2757(-)